MGRQALELKLWPLLIDRPITVIIKAITGFIFTEADYPLANLSVRGGGYTSPLAAIGRVIIPIKPMGQAVCHLTGCILVTNAKRLGEATGDVAGTTMFGHEGRGRQIVNLSVTIIIDAVTDLGLRVEGQG